MALSEYSGTLRFGDFVLDVAAYELRRNGHRVRLERQPMNLLILLVGRRGELVSRSEIVDALWSKDVFVDVENGVNTAIRKLRQALRDAPDTPRFIETVPGKGYRFIAAVETLTDAVVSPPPPAAASPAIMSLRPPGAWARAWWWELSRWRCWRPRSSGYGSGRRTRAHA